MDSKQLLASCDLLNANGFAAGSKRFRIVHSVAEAELILRQFGGKHFSSGTAHQALRDDPVFAVPG